MIDVEVVGITDVADGVRAVEFARPDGAMLPAWDPGAHIDVQLPSGLMRQYSLSSNPADTHRWRIGVLRALKSRGASEWLHANITTGSALRVSLPRNHFQLVDAPAYRFVAGGIGITPLLPMIAALERSGADWRLLYGGRTRGSMAFLDELPAYGERVVVQPQDESGLLDLATYLADPRPGEQVYACGPEPMLAATEAAAAAWPSGALHVERFVPALIDDSGDTSFEVEFSDAGVSATVEPGVTILEIAERLGIAPESSCREGTCGTCETVILEGSADHRDTILSAADREANESMMVCVSRAARGCGLLKLAL